jgi:hypothetical protein
VTTNDRIAMRILTGAFALVFVVGAAWVWTYPDGDPKNIKYVLWKAGFYRMNLDTAADTMIGDGSHDRLVVGKTKAQLWNKFGYLLAPSDASQYLKGCYQNSGWKNEEVLFIRQSPWMVVFDGDKATQLVLIKGC